MGKRAGHDVYGLKNVEDLTPLLGRRWFIRILNKQKDHCYVNADTVQYWLHQRKAIEEYDEEGEATTSNCSTLYTLVFKFVRMDGVSCNLQNIL